MLAYIARRLALAVGTVLAAIVITFLLVHAGNTTPGAVRLGPGATADRIAAENEALGWNRPLFTQFTDYVGQLLQGNLGTSLIDGRDIAADLTDRLPVTASIALFATLLSGVVGILLGVAAAVRGGRTAQGITTGSGVALSLPSFWVGILLVYLLSLQLGWLPATGYTEFSTDPVGWATSLAIPVLTLAVGGAAIVTRTAAAGMREALAQEHVRTLRAMGTPQWRIRYVHALRYASVPVVSVLGIQFIVLFGGSVIIENLFALPGLGQASQVAAVSSDFPALIGVVVVATVVVVITNLLLDLLVAALDPKVRTA
ncbi:ABC transporter permease [Geodermatophilus aquaeductus]|uniref:Peptide/nickel transport system permease protein n=1 Tax=Geodermatophilus aquaeductus TaxID=1564161 RepID=A0A521FIC6_9ACTN|nr:ABC transporter permease [Geodermatophilus aquaeductus]SMO95876.1 peptide/nickel transport system permease protein [Geodermatophilus aquaeductus]